MDIQANKDKKLSIATTEGEYLRIPIKTHLITREDNIEKIVRTYALPHLQEGDILFVSERIVAITQGRAYKLEEINPSRLAKFLSRHVTKTPAGIGIGSPYTMELAIHEAGALRILFAAAIAAITKPFGARGIFYHVVGNRINAIDGPCDYTLSPFGKYAKLGPKDPDLVAQALSHVTHTPVVIIDANDLGVEILGKSTPSLKNAYLKELFRDNPLGQTDEQTPMAIVRKSS